MTITHGQDQPMLIFTGKVTDVSGKKLDGVQVVIKKTINPLKPKLPAQMENMTSLKLHLVISTH